VDSTPIPVKDSSFATSTAEASEVKKATEDKPDSGQTIQGASLQPAPAESAPIAAQIRSSVQEDKSGFIRALMAQALAKIHSNRQKKLEILMESARKKRRITNDEAQKILRVSDKTAERYLKELVEQGKLERFGSTRDAHYGVRG